MTVAVIALAIALAGAIAAIILLARKVEASLDDRIAASKAALDYERLWNEEKQVAEGYIAQRNANAVKAAELDALNSALKMRLAMVEQERNRALAEAVKDVRQRIASAGSAADGFAVFDSIMSAPLSSLPKAAGTGASGDGGAREAAVQPASATGASAAQGTRSDGGK